MLGFRRFAERYLIADAAPLSSRERTISALAGLAGILVMQGVLAVLPGTAATNYLLAPLGASAVILFALPHSPLAQPWSLAGGLLISAAVGHLCGLWLQPAWLAVGVALGAAIWLTALLRCIHPPGGAMAVIFALGAQQQTPLLSTAALNVLAALIAALAVNSLLPGRRYPQCGAAKPAGRPPRRGIGHDDLQFALHRLDTYLDISEDDLVSIYDLATGHAHGRHERRTCGDLMSAPAVCVEFGSGLNEAWALLRDHHLHGLPVVDRARRVIGVLTLDDFLRHVRPDGGPGIGDNIRRLLRPAPASHSDKPEVVGQIMSARFAVAATTTPLSEIAGLLAGADHPLIVPVVDGERRLAGVLTQTDLLAALYHRQAADAAQHRSHRG